MRQSLDDEAMLVNGRWFFHFVQAWWTEKILIAMAHVALSRHLTTSGTS
jgi:hypothetical protein